MQLDLSGHHVEVTEAMRGYVLKKFERISRHYEQLIDIHCVLTVEHLRHKAEATVLMSGNVDELPAWTVGGFEVMLTLGSGADRIDLFYFGRGHTNNDSWVVFPALRPINIVIVVVTG